MRSGSSSAHKYSDYSVEFSRFQNIDQGISNNFSISKHLQPCDYPDEIFSFDDNMCRGRRKADTFPKFQMEPQCDIIAAALIEQNSYLKERLRCSQKTIKELQSENCHYRQQLFHLKEQFQIERTSFQRKVEQFRSEILAIIFSNKQLETQLRALRGIVQERKYNKSLSRKKSCSKSYDHLSLKENRHILNINSIQTGSSLDGRKMQDLLDSIRSMHFKIMGVRANSLKELWRWLKGVAQVYSCLRKWQQKFADLNLHSRNEKFREAVAQVFQILD